MTEAQPTQRSRSGFLTRLFSTIVLLGLFCATMWGGHIPCAAVMVAFQVMISDLLHLRYVLIEGNHSTLHFAAQTQFFATTVGSPSKRCSAFRR
jgi:hypothetical protein